MGFGAPGSIKRPFLFPSLCVLLFVLMAVAASVGAVWGRRNLVENDRAFSLYIEPSALDFGTVWSQRSFEWKVPIRNRGAMHLNAVKLKTSCYCAVVHPDVVSLSPGEQTEVRVTLDLTTAAATDIEELQQFSVGLTASLDESSLALCSWEINGKVRSLFTLTPSEVDLGAEAVVGSTVSPLSIDVQTRETVSSVGVRSSSGLIRPRIHKKNGRSFDLTLGLDHELFAKIGGVAATVEVFGIDSTGAEFSPTKISVHGQVVPDIRAHPTAVRLGLEPVGTIRSAEIILVSKLGRPFSVEDVSTNDDSVSVEELPCTSASESRYRVIQRIGNLGDQSSRIRFWWRLDDSGAASYVDVFVRYHGTESQ